MASGGARLRSGPPPDPDSARSERLGRTNGKLRLPPGGYHGTPPEYPLADHAPREIELWEELWTTPQAAAWATMPYMHHIIANYVRYTVRAEDPESPANVLTVALRMADSIGLSPGGLNALGWMIDNDDLVIREDEPDRDNPKVVSMRSRRRLPGDDAGAKQ